MALMLYPFTDSLKKEDLTSEKINTGTILNISEKYYKIDPIPSGQLFNNFLYSNSCSNYINAKVNANTKIPMTKLKAGLEVDKEMQSSILSYGGDFLSPIYSIISDKNNSLSRINLYGELWRYLCDQKSNGMNIKLIKNIEAITFSEISKGSSSIFLGGQGVLNIEASFFDLNADIKAGLARNEKYRGSFYNLLLSTKIEKINYFPLPTPKEIADFYASLKPDVVDKSMEIDQYSVHTHSIQFSGLPECFKNNNWDLEFDNKNLFDSPVVIYDRENSTQDISRFLVKATPKTELFSDKTQSSITANYWLVRKGEKIGEQRLGLRMSDMSFRLSNDLKVLDKDVDAGALGISSLNRKMNWLFDINYQDALNNVNFSDVSSCKIEIVSPLPDSYSGLNLIGRVLSGSAASKSMKINLETEYDTSKFYSDNTITYIVVEARVTFRIKNSTRDAYRNFFIKLPIIRTINSSNDLK